jgi:nicotinamidase-related amidase
VALSAEAPPWLVAVDLQRAFADRGSPWFTPGVGSIAGIVADLVPQFGPRVIFTRFVPPREVEGSWRSYYEKWRFAAGTRDSDLWSVIEPWDRAVSVSSHTFSKWVPELQTLVGPHPTIVLCGVSTDCCILATAFAAVDGGAHVRVVADACTANTPELHEAALLTMRGRAPQLTVVTSKEEVAGVFD